VWQKYSGSHHSKLPLGEQKPPGLQSESMRQLPAYAHMFAPASYRRHSHGNPASQSESLKHSS
jgi:hypothetical protein